MCAQAKRRPRRVPLSSEEVAHIIQLKKRKEQIQLIQFKKSTLYKFFNIFNVCCFFIYWELILCFFGPCSYRLHFTESVYTKFGGDYNANDQRMISELKIKDVNGFEYELIVEDFLNTPSNFTKFLLGSDFILGKKLKAKVESSDKSYRLFSASPILLLSILALIISSIVIMNDLNHNAYSLIALSVLNILAMLSILAL